MPTRFIPVDTSLSSDAPGYGEALGPICWKCRGGNKNCKVCHGDFRLPVRIIVPRIGKVTRGRKDRPQTSQNHAPFGYNVPYYGPLVKRATEEMIDVVLKETPPSTTMPPDWWPRDNEELCNLVGEFRILQKYKSHRWTTDDLVTATVAAKTLLSDRFPSQRIRYCDLGTGNGSVLQMMIWKCRSRIETAYAVEARKEALGLARRSLSFNVGKDVTKPDISLVHSDFRTFPPPELANTFDLVTGTPPYFAVESVNDTTTVIQQGAMPAAMQSAPARCEFRGGMEAYCAAAQRLLRDSGRFVCCENYLNHTRAIQALEDHEFLVEKVLFIRGREGRERLFAVYVAQKSSSVANAKIQHNPIGLDLSVRNVNGDWTDTYKESILRFMDILA